MLRSVEVCQHLLFTSSIHSNVHVSIKTRLILIKGILFHLFCQCDVVNSNKMLMNIYILVNSETTIHDQCHFQSSNILIFSNIHVFAYPVKVIWVNTHRHSFLQYPLCALINYRIMQQLSVTLKPASNMICHSPSNAHLGHYFFSNSRGMTS